MKKAVIGISVVLVVVCGVGGLMLKGKGATDDKDKGASNYTVKKDDLVVTVVDTGTIDATRTVEVKSRVSGRLSKLLVDEGSVVKQGQLIAVIDPQETELKVQQDAASLRGAQSSVAKANAEIKQRVLTAKATYDQALAKVVQLKLEVKAQPALTQAAIAEAQASLNTALQQREQLLTNTQPNLRTTTQSALSEAKANYDNALAEFKRQNQLGNMGYVAGRSVDSAKLTLDLAQVRLDGAKQNMDRLEAQIRTDKAKADEAVRQAEASLARAKVNQIQIRSKQEDLKSAEAEVIRSRALLDDVTIMEKGRDQSQATVDQLSAILHDSQRNLGETDVRAPMDGVVTKKLLQVGELASGLSGFQSGTGIVRIEDRRNMRVMLEVNEIDVAKMKDGMSATINVDAFPGHPYKGIIRRIAPASTAAGTTTTTTSDAVVKFEVEVVITNPDNNLRSGMSAKCSVDVIRKNGVLVIPIEFISREADGVYVEIPGTTPGSKPTRRKITTGAETGSKIEVIDGLKEGEKIQKPKYTGPERKGMMQAGPEDK